LIQEAVLEKLENLDLTTEPIGHTILSLGQSSEIIVPTVSGNIPASKISARNQKESMELQEPKTNQSVKN